MQRDDDLFDHFERMRRHMDELFGDAWERIGIGHHRAGSFSPKVDVYYSDNPATAVVTADLAGVEIENVALEIQGRRLVISGERCADDMQENRVYQQIEIEHGQFRRVVELGVDVIADQASASYQEGMLKVQLPLAAPEPVAVRPVKKATTS